MKKYPLVKLVLVILVLIYPTILLAQDKVCSQLQSKASSLSKAGNYEEAEKIYLNLIENYSDKCKNICSIIYEAGNNYKQNGEIGKSIVLWRLLLTQYRDCDKTKQAVYEIGKGYYDIISYDKACEYYERFAQLFPGETKAPQSLIDAVKLRTGLGDIDKAIDDANLFIKLYGIKKIGESLNLLFSIGDSLEKNKQWDKLRQFYENYLTFFEQSGPDYYVRAFSNIGYSLWNQNDIDNAVKSFNNGLVEYYSAGLDKNKEKNINIDLYYKVPRNYELMNSIAKARFYIAEKEYIQFKNKIDQFPVFAPQSKIPQNVKAWYIKKNSIQKLNAIQKLPASKRINKIKGIQFDYWAENELVPWMSEMKILSLRINDLYLEALNERIPYYMLFSASRIGDINKLFADIIKNLPPHPELEANPELLKAYQEAVGNDISETYYKNAELFYERCQTISKSHKLFNEISRECEINLNKINPTKYPYNNF